MQFLNPVALVGLAAAVLPLAIHLLHRGRPRDVPFSNLAFLRQLQQSRMRDVRLRQWLVLLLRTLILLCLALAFARPALVDGGGLLGGARPRTAVLLVDRSYSTRYAPTGGRIFDRLRRRAESVLALLDDDDEVYLLPFDERTGPAEGPLSPAAARQRLEEYVPGQGGTDVAAAVRTAGELLAARPGRQGEVYLLTDLASPGWTAVDSLAAAVHFFVVAADSGAAANLYAGTVHTDGWLAAVGRPLTVAAVVGQHGGAGAEVTVDLFLDGERVRRRLARPGTEAPTSVPFTVAPRRSGLLWGHVAVEDNALPLDNRRYFTLNVPARLHVILAGASPGDLYYPRRALGAAAEGDATLTVTSMGMDDLADADLAGADVLVLAQVEAPSAAQIRAVHDFAARGGGVLILPGADADLTRLNRELLAGLVPAALAAVSGHPGGDATVRIDSATVATPLLAGLFSDPRDQPRFRAAYDIVPQRQLAVLARFDDGRPALVEGRDGGGRALLWATPLDLAWTDLPLRGALVPLLHRLCRYLAQPVAGDGYTVGERAWRPLPGLGLDTRVEVEAPSGRRQLLQPETVLDEVLWQVPRLDEAGIWRVYGDGADREDGDLVDRFAVNVDVAEADLRRLDAAAVRQRLGAGVHLLSAGAPLAAAVTAARYGRELWPGLLALAGLLLMVELWIARAPTSGSHSAAPSGSRSRNISKV